jgi:uncharacterized membrane-anchored protein YjiN (DUF445 family)
MDGKRYRRKPEPKPNQQQEHDVSREAIRRKFGDAAARIANDLADMFIDLAEDFDERIGDALCRMIEAIAADLTGEQRDRITKALLDVDDDA